MALFARTPKATVSDLDEVRTELQSLRSEVTKRTNELSLVTAAINTLAYPHRLQLDLGKVVAEVKSTWRIGGVVNCSPLDLSLLQLAQRHVTGQRHFGDKELSFR